MAGAAAAGENGKTTGAALKEDLDRLRVNLNDALDEAGKALLEKLAKKEEQAQIERWRDESKQRYRQALDNKDPRAALVDVWALSARQQTRLKTGADKDLFGASHDIAEKAGGDNYRQARELAASYLPPRDFDDIEKRITEYSAAPEKEGASLLTQTVSGLNNQLSGAIDLGRSFVRGITGVADLPGSVKRGTEDFARFTDAVEAMPQRLRRELEQLIKDMEASQTTLRQTLGDVRMTLEKADEALMRADHLTTGVNTIVRSTSETIATVRQAADSITAAAQASQALMAAVNAYQKEAEQQRLREESRIKAGGAPAHEFDVREYSQAAQSIEQGSQEVRKLMEAIERLTTDSTRDEKNKKGNEHPFDVRDYTQSALAFQQSARDTLKMLEAIERLTTDSAHGDRNKKDDHPFDIREYTEAARAGQASSAEFRSLLAEVNALAASTTATQNITPVMKAAQDTLDLASARANRAIDHLAWRLIQIIGLLFLTIVLLMVIRKAINRKTAQ
ncbi:MAG: hypothetical protein NTX50_09150 [Candidatus Sumerlaeota bacterium]|nr:hypothetical protein [Candidatus Sumerlaeota bacterium]